MKRNISNETNTSSMSNSSSISSSSNKKRPPVFPKRLYDMLENAERDGYDHVISWMPDGESFKIHVDGSLDEEDEKAIVEILKRTFNQTRFKSFLRQLQLYGFERTYKGPHRGECKHGLFVRGRRDLLRKKSIEDFQQKANDSSNRSPKSVRKLFQSQLSPTPAEESSFMKNCNFRNSNNDSDSDNVYTMPSCPPLTSNTEGSKCQYLKTSIIPTRLINLVLSDSDSVQNSQSDASNDGYGNDDDNEYDYDYDYDELSLVIDCPLLNKEIQVVGAIAIHDYDDDADLMSINSGENFTLWTGMELDILRDAL